MKKFHIVTIAVFLSSAHTLFAQDGLKPSPRVPDPTAYQDLLKDGRKPAAVAVARPAVQAKGLPQPAAKSVGDAVEESRAIERFIAEARMHLVDIVENSRDLEQEAKVVFDEAMELITARLNELKLKEGEQGADKSKAGVGASRESKPAAAVSIGPDVKDTGRGELKAGSNVPASRAVNTLQDKKQREAILSGPLPENALWRSKALDKAPKAVERELKLKEGALDSAGTETGIGQLSPIEASLLSVWAKKMRVLADQMAKEVESFESKTARVIREK